MWPRMWGWLGCLSDFRPRNDRQKFAFGLRGRWIR